MFFLRKPPISVYGSPSLPFVPMPERTHVAKVACYEHAKTLTDIFRRKDLSKYRFELRQRSNTGYPVEGRLFLVVEQITETEQRKCLLRFCGTKGGNWVYHVTHPDFSANEIHNIFFEAFGKKDRAYLQGAFKYYIQHFAGNLRNRLSQ